MRSVITKNFNIAETDWCLLRGLIYIAFSRHFYKGTTFYYNLKGIASSECVSFLFKGFVVYSTNRSNAVVPVLVLLFVALWFILRGDLF